MPNNLSLTDALCANSCECLDQLMEEKYSKAICGEFGIHNKAYASPTGVE
eukprot:CAMPEP_0176500146 /NCGR_PEP_ID=MMETSP0200_2-20121128/13357_1 /TAXON_ID=947934 /ORGANISM="Chaetoceros sp., Strain GSL56" /LENGTH=49 /DNA_ID=CAMNT_0017898717 /DNA_START=92 /DNA_END=241 /DNA_ORIENTATION=-